MTLFVLLLALGCVAVMGFVVFLVIHQNLLLREEAAEALDHSHAVCLSMVAAFVGDRFAAQVLMAAADHLSGMDGQAELRRVANTMWDKDDPQPVPSLWLRERAEAILAKTSVTDG